MGEMRAMIGEILVEMGCATETQVQEALELQMNGDERKIGQILIETEVVKDEDMACALAEQQGIEMVDLEFLDLPREITDRIPQDRARQYNVVPIDFADDILTVAIADPLDLVSLDELRFFLNCQVEPVLATPQAVKDALNKYYGMTEDEMDRMMSELTESQVEIIQTGDTEAESEADDAPVIKLVTMIILNAVKSRASDIHIEPMADRLRIRYRVDGKCFEVEPPPKRLQGPVLSRIKIMAQMQLDEKRRPQDGRIKINLLGRDLDLRVSALPATHGESIVMRILDQESVQFGLAELGFHPDDNEVFDALIKKPNGILLITGPTGSGKTTTLYAALNTLNTTDRKIITAENPVEYNLNGVNQCNVNEKIGFTFQIILRAMLRQAPNVILVGEIRDGETADVAIQAALTGHLVFSTLHTNDAPGSITRLIDMGVAPFLVASSIQAVMAQRLVRMFCPSCKVPTEPDIPKLKSAGLREQDITNRTFYIGQGCEECRGTGFKGRKGIFEMMVMNNRLRELAFNKSPTDKIRDQAINDGMMTLFQDGLRKVLDGWTTIDEILHVAIDKE